MPPTTSPLKVLHVISSCQPVSYFNRWASFALLIPIVLSFSAAAIAQDNSKPASDRGRIPELLPYIERNELAGAVAMLASKDEVLVAEAVGYADIDAGIPMQLDSMFWIASQSKPITAAALMILVDEGKVQLDDPIEKYLPEFAGLMIIAEKDESHLLLRTPKTKPTIRSILSHTSGMPFKSKLEEPRLDLFPLRARVRSYAMTPIEFEPSTKYQYSNAGINTAACIIEAVTGTSFEDFLQSRLLHPLEMLDTTFWPSEAQEKRIAKAYKPGKENVGLVETEIDQLTYPLHDRTRRFPMPAGGLFSTATDVCHFYQMLLHRGVWRGKRILSEDSVTELTKRQTSSEIKESYGLGFSSNGSSFGHGGAYSTNTQADSERDEILIWLVQHAGFPGNGGQAQHTFHEAARKLRGQR